jgi:hypothetical protein
MGMANGAKRSPQALQAQEIEKLAGNIGSVA